MWIGDTAWPSLSSSVATMHCERDKESRVEGLEVMGCGAALTKTL